MRSARWISSTHSTGRKKTGWCGSVLRKGSSQPPETAYGRSEQLRPYGVCGSDSSPPNPATPQAAEPRIAPTPAPPPAWGAPSPRRAAQRWMCGHGVGDDVVVEVAGRHPIHHREQCRLRIGRAVIAREGAIVPVPGTRERVRPKWLARNRSEDLPRAVRVIDRERLAVAATTDLYFASAADGRSIARLLGEQHANTPLRIGAHDEQITVLNGLHLHTRPFAAKVDVVGEFDFDWWVAERRRRQYGKHQGGQGEQHGSSVVGWVSTTGGQSKSVPGNDVTRCDIPGTDVFAARPAPVSRRGQVSSRTVRHSTPGVTLAYDKEWNNLNSGRRACVSRHLVWGAWGCRIFTARAMTPSRSPRFIARSRSGSISSIRPTCTGRTRTKCSSERRSRAVAIR